MQRRSRRAAEAVDNGTVIKELPIDDCRLTIARTAAIRGSWLVARVLCVLCVFLCALCVNAFSTTVTAMLIDSTGAPIANGKVTFLIQNYGVGNIPRVQGTGIVVQTSPIVALANASGQISVVIQGNDTITPAGTYYQVTFYNGNAVYLQANYSITGSTLDLTAATPLSVIPAVPPNQAYTTVEAVGSILQQRQIINFLSGVTCADDSTNSSTDCTASGGGSGSTTIETNGTLNTSQTLLNFENGTDITASNPSGGIEQFNFTGVLAATQSATAHEWLNSYTASTGAFTATQPALSDISLPTETANYFWAAPNGSSGTPSFRAIVAADVPTLNQSTTGNAATATALAATPSQCSGGDVSTGIAASGAANCTSAPAALTIASGTATLGTTAIASGACASVVTVAATGVAATDVIETAFNGDPTAVAGYGVSSTGAVLTIYPYPTAGDVNFKVCNSTSASITPGALTLNWRVSR
jgi:hypothetical protein